MMAKRLLPPAALLSALLLTAPGQAGVPTNVTIELSFGNSAVFLTGCEALGSENEVIEQEVMTPQGPVIRKLPGRMKWLDVRCHRGLTNSMTLAAWRKQVEDGNVAAARTSVTMVYFDSTFSPFAEWTLANAWPSRLSVESDGAAVERLTLVHEGMQRVR